MKRFLVGCAILAALGACRDDGVGSPNAPMRGKLAVPAAATPAAAAAPVAPAIPPITIYHLEGRRSERIVWLMEELSLPYKLEFKRGDLAGSMAAIKQVNPGMPVAPTVDIGGQVMVESGAIIETILNRYAPDKLQPGVDSPDYPYHLMWMHYAEGSLASRAIADYRVWQVALPKERSRLVDSEQVVQFAEDWLGTHAWFGGQDFSAADIMMVFPLNFAMELNIVDKTRFPRITEWKSRIEARPAYQAMLAKARPDGMVGALTPLKVHAPAGPRPAAPAAAVVPAPAKPVATAAPKPVTTDPKPAAGEPKPATPPVPAPAETPPASPPN